MKLTPVLGAAIALAAPAAAQKATTVVPIQLYSFGYLPTPISLRAGAPVTLVFTDVAGISHEFKAPAFFHNARIISGAVEEDGAVDLKPNQSASVTLVPMRGTYAVHCGHFMHKQLGMRTLIYVQ
jgi:plastocyanin